MALQSVTDSVFEQATVTKSGGLFTKMSDRGRYDETVRMVEIAARGPLTIDSTLGIAAEVVHQGGSLQASLDVLGQRSGLEWVAPRPSPRAWRNGMKFMCSRARRTLSHPTSG